MAEQALPDEFVELIAERFRALGEPLRIRILEQLRGGPKSVQELVAALGTSQQNISKHLGILRGLGVVNRRKDGPYAYYAIEDDTVLDLCEQVCGTLERRIAQLHQMIGRGNG